MSASSSAMDSAHWFRRLAITAFERYQAARQRIAIVILDIKLSGQCRPSPLHRLRERTEAETPIATHDEFAEDNPKARAIEIESERVGRKIRRQIASPKPGWVNATIYALLAGCWAITVCGVFQAPFRILLDDCLTGAVRPGVEIAALPASLATRSMSHFQAQGRKQNAGYHKELVANPVDDSGHKRQPVRERAFPGKQSRIGIRLGQLAQRR
jgi:hypothetical protein